MSSFKVHALKVQSVHFNEVLAGRKTSEVRLDDRNYLVGDVISLHEIDENEDYTGQAMNAEITHVLSGGQYGLDEQWCVLSFSNVTHLNAKRLIEYLRDRLEETCACIECCYESIRNDGCVTTDAESTVEAGRLFIKEANEFLSTIGEES